MTPPTSAWLSRHCLRPRFLLRASLFVFVAVSFDSQVTLERGANTPSTGKSSNSSSSSSAVADFLVASWGWVPASVEAAAWLSFCGAEEAMMGCEELVAGMVVVELV